MTRNAKINITIAIVAFLIGLAISCSGCNGGTSQKKRNPAYDRWNESYGPEADGKKPPKHIEDKMEEPETAEDIARQIVFEDSTWYDGGDPDKLGAKGIDLEALAELIAQAIDNAVQAEKMRAQKGASK